MDYEQYKKIDARLHALEMQSNLILHTITALTHDVARLSRQETDADNRLTQFEGKIMAVADDIRAAIANLDTETTAIGTLITALAGKVKNSMTDQEVTDVKTAFAALSDRLTSLGQDPSNPVPPPPPALTTAKTFAHK